jgi:predicted Zn-dependent peptidase
VLSTQAQAPRNVRVDFKETTLKNGLRVITVEDHSAPVVALSITYNVGSRNEREGRTGFAHLFEHMMFKGSENVGSGEYYMLIFNNGGNMNGTTNEDRTNYFAVLPANQLDLALFLESDRMKSLAITKENLDNQRNAVQEFSDWFDGRPERSDCRRRCRVLQDVLRTEQRNARSGR